MLNFIVLGYVPGTSIQITFYSLLLVVSCILMALLLILLAQYHIARRKYTSMLPVLLKKPLRAWFRQNTLAV